MVLIFAPTAVLAAKPLAYCVGANAHRALEYVYVAGPNHHGYGSAAQRVVGVHLDGPFEPSAAVPVNSCIDFAVLSTAQLAEHKTDHKLAAPPPVPTNPSYIAADSAYESAQLGCQDHFASRATRALHPQLAGLRTIKLLN